MEGLKNFLQLIYDNWTLIITIIGLSLAVYKRIKNYMALSQEEKIQIAKDRIKETILSYVTSAEGEFADFKKSGEIKRADVIKKIYSDYPILNVVVNQKELTVWLDDLIDDSLISLREIIDQA